MSSTLTNWRTINIDALDPDSPANFDLSSLTPDVVPVSAADVQHLATQCRQLLRGGDSEGALRGALENAPYGGDEKGKVRRSSISWRPRTWGREERKGVSSRGESNGIVLIFLFLRFHQRMDILGERRITILLQFRSLIFSRSLSEFESTTDRNYAGNTPGYRNRNPPIHPTV